MNQHMLPPSNILREVTFTKPAVNEQFIVLRGKHEQWLEDRLMDRHSVIAEVADDQDRLRQIIAFDLVNGTSRDATDDICGVIIERWAQDGKLLTEAQKAWVAMCKGEAFANAFRLEECA
jgi:hypothetical protein